MIVRIVAIVGALACLGAYQVAEGGPSGPKVQAYPGKYNTQYFDFRVEPLGSGISASLTVKRAHPAFFRNHSVVLTVAPLRSAVDDPGNGGLICRLAPDTTEAGHVYQVRLDEEMSWRTSIAFWDLAPNSADYHISEFSIRDFRERE